MHEENVNAALGESEGDITWHCQNWKNRPRHKHKIFRRSEEDAEDCGDDNDDFAKEDIG